MNKKQAPGPGQYMLEDIVARMRKKVWGKQGPFGSTERRFAQAKRFVLALIKIENTWTWIL